MSIGWRLFALLVAATAVPTLHAVPLMGLAGAAVPVAALTAAIIAALAFVLLVSVAEQIRLTPATLAPANHGSRRRAPRSTDPDAAGHVRPRAPGSISTR